MMHHNPNRQKNSLERRLCFKSTQLPLHSLAFSSFIFNFVPLSSLAFIQLVILNFAQIIQQRVGSSTENIV